MMKSSMMARVTALWLGLMCAAALCVLALAGPRSAWAQENPTRSQSTAKRGFDAKSAYTVSDVDSINLFSGALSVSIPIGPAMSVGPQLTYQLRLIYNAHPWDHVDRLGLPQAATDTTITVPVQGAVSFPALDNNAGLGWKLSLGELLPPVGPGYQSMPLPEARANTSHRWMFVGPDGAKHAFFSSLDARNDIPGVDNAPMDAAALYTRGATHIRLKRESDRTRLVEFPDGTVYEFHCPASLANDDFWYTSNNVNSEHCWRLVRIFDLRGGRNDKGDPVNQIRIAYSSDGGGFKRTLTDAFDRRVELKYQANTEIDRTAPVPVNVYQPFGWITSVSFPATVSAAPATSRNDSSQRATYTFDYGQTALQDVTRGCHSGLATIAKVFTGNDSAPWADISGSVKTPMLQRVVLPDGSSYDGFVYHVPPGDTRSCNQSRDKLAELRYPTGAKVRWTYGMYNQPPTYSCTFVPGSGDESEGARARAILSKGVVRKVVVDAAENVLSATDYIPASVGERLMERLRINLDDVIRTWPDDVCRIVHRQFTTTVVDQRGLATVHYFNTFNEPDTWGGVDNPSIDLLASSVESGWRTDEYGRNFTHYDWRLKGSGEPYVPPQDSATQPAVPPAPSERMYLQSETFDCQGRSIPGLTPGAGGPGWTIDGATLGAQSAFGKTPPQSWRSTAGAAGYYRPNTVRACGDRLRATYVVQETDLSTVVPFNGTVACVSSSGANYDCNETNLRTTYEFKIVAEKDSNQARVEKTAGVVNSEYRLGRFGRAQTMGSSVGYERTLTRTQVDSAPPALTEPWRLTDVDWTKTIQGDEDGGQTVRRFYWFDPQTGFLRAKRLVRDLQDGDSHLKPTDVYVRYEPDANGYVAQERIYGGDLNPATWTPPGETSANWPSQIGHLPELSALGRPAYRREYTYRVGQLEQERWLDPQSGAPLLTTQRNTVDPATGWLLRTEDAAGVGADYGYDAMGRLKWTASDGLTWQRYTYCTDLRDERGNPVAAPAGCLATERNAIYAEELAGNGTVLSEASHFYDAWGRLTESKGQYLGTGGALNEPMTRASRECVRYGVAGQIDQQLDAEDAAGPMRESTCPAQSHGDAWRALSDRSYLFTYDVQGRERTKTLPKTGPDRVDQTTTYNGDRMVTVESAVAVPAENSTTFGPDTGSTVKKTIKVTKFDSTGRLRSVSEPSRTFADTAYCNGTLDPERPGDRRCLVETFFTYNVNDQLTDISTPLAAPEGANPASQRRITRYDALGWLVSADVPELQGTGGQVTQLANRYDVFGTATRLSWRRGTTEAPSRVVSTSLDALGRAVATDVDIGRGPQRIAETMYASQNGTGALAEDRKAGKPVMTKRYNHGFRGLDDLVITERYRYEHPAGLATQSTLSAARLLGEASRDGADWVLATNLDYDAQGQLTTLNYPGCGSWGCGGRSMPSRAAIYEYQNGALKRVKQRESGLQSVLATLTYHPGGQTHFVWHSLGGNLLREEWNVDAMQRVAQMSVTHAVGGGGIKLIGFDDFQYDPSGNLIGVARAGADHADRYWYDLVGRLVGGTVSHGNQRQMQRARYDRFGNITHLHSAGVDTALNPDPQTNRLSSLATYDAYGNVVGWNGASLEYDGLDMPTAHFDEEEDVFQTYAYGPGNRRVATFDSSTDEEKWTLRGAAAPVLREVRRDDGGDPAWVRDTIHAGARQLAAYAAEPANSEFRFFVDHLGSTRLVLDGKAAPFAEFDYLPFGEYAREDYFTEGGGAEGALRFTGHERDKHRDGGDLDYMQARYYAPRLGRFLALDPLTGSPNRPQSLNRYTYVRNSPLVRNDPTGMADKPAATRTTIEFEPNKRRVSNGTVTPEDVVHLKSMEIERQLALERGQIDLNAPPTPRTGEMQRQWKEAGMPDPPDGYELDHGKDLQVGGKDDLSNARVRPTYANRSAGPQMRREVGRIRAALNSPLADKLKKFIPGVGVASIAVSLQAGRYKEAAIAAGGELPLVGWAVDAGDLGGAAVQTDTVINFLATFQGDGRR